jgi:hypothetical protein
MMERLSASPVVLLADSYFVKKQHEVFVQILEEVSTAQTVLCLERQVLSFAEKGDVLETLGYGDLIRLARARELEVISVGMSLEGEDPGMIDFYTWDRGIAERVRELLDEGKRVLLIVGDTHASIGHLPFIIEAELSVDPAVVSQAPPNLNLKDLLDGREGVSRKLRELGLGENNALVVGNDYFLYTETSGAELTEYLERFGLKEAVQGEG